jgi:hypothetical protein
MGGGAVQLARDQRPDDGRRGAGLIGVVVGGVAAVVAMPAVVAAGFCAVRRARPVAGLSDGLVHGVGEGCAGIGRSA